MSADIRTDYNPLAKIPSMTALDSAGDHSLDRLVLLRLSELVALVTLLRDKAYKCRLFASECWEIELRQKALDAAERLEVRANALAQANAPAERRGNQPEA